MGPIVKALKYRTAYVSSLHPYCMQLTFIQRCFNPEAGEEISRLLVGSAWEEAVGSLCAIEQSGWQGNGRHV